MSQTGHIDPPLSLPHPSLSIWLSARDSMQSQQLLSHGGKKMTLSKPKLLFILLYLSNDFLTSQQEMFTVKNIYLKTL